MFNPQQALLQYSNVENSVKAENSTAYDLTKMLFDGCLKAMSLTIFHIKNKDFSSKSIELSRSLSIINGLRDCLDLEKGGELASNLDELYQYMAKSLRESSVSNDIVKIQHVHELLREIRLGWEAMPVESRRY